jgi:hypothetical protein
MTGKAREGMARNPRMSQGKTIYIYLFIYAARAPRLLTHAGPFTRVFKQIFNSLSLIMTVV